MTTPGNGKDPANRPPPFMDQIWKTLAKINASIEKLQENQTSTQAESHSKFVDMEKCMKSLDNSSRGPFQPKFLFLGVETEPPWPLKEIP